MVEALGVPTKKHPHLISSITLVVSVVQNVMRRDNRCKYCRHQPYDHLDGSGPCTVRGCDCRKYR